MPSITVVDDYFFQRFQYNFLCQHNCQRYKLVPAALVTTDNSLSLSTPQRLAVNWCSLFLLYKLASDLAYYNIQNTLHRTWLELDTQQCNFF